MECKKKSTDKLFSNIGIKNREKNQNALSGKTRQTESLFYLDFTWKIRSTGCMFSRAQHRWHVFPRLARAARLSSLWFLIGSMLCFPFCKSLKLALESAKKVRPSYSRQIQFFHLPIIILQELSLPVIQLSQLSAGFLVQAILLTFQVLHLQLLDFCGDQT